MIVVFKKTDAEFFTLRGLSDEDPTNPHEYGRNSSLMWWLTDTLGEGGFAELNQGRQKIYHEQETQFSC